MKKTKEQTENCLTSDLQGMLYEMEAQTLYQADLFRFFADVLLAANVDSEIVVNVLERPQFGNLAKEIARSIKVDEGW